MLPKQDELSLVCLSDSSKAATANSYWQLTIRYKKCNCPLARNCFSCLESSRHAAHSVVTFVPVEAERAFQSPWSPPKVGNGLAVVFNDPLGHQLDSIGQRCSTIWELPWTSFLRSPGRARSLDPST
jgi:hypothetical protein